MKRVVTFKFPKSGDATKCVECFCIMGILTRFEHFRKMFERWKEGSSGEVTISDTDAETFNHFLHYAQSGKVEQSLDIPSLVKLLHLGNKYFLYDLLACCLLPTLCLLDDIERMKTQSPAALAELLLFADVAETACPMLKQKVVESILRFRGDAVKDRDFLASVAAGSIETLAELVAPVAPIRDEAGIFDRPQKWRKIEEAMMAKVWCGTRTSSAIPCWSTR